MFALVYVVDPTMLVTTHPCRLFVSSVTRNLAYLQAINDVDPARSFMRAIAVILRYPGLCRYKSWCVGFGAPQVARSIADMPPDHAHMWGITHVATGLKRSQVTAGR